MLLVSRGGRLRFASAREGRVYRYIALAASPRLTDAHGLLRRKGSAITPEATRSCARFNDGRTDRDGAL